MPRRGRAAVVALSLACHVLVFLALVLAPKPSPVIFEPEPLNLALVELHRPTKAPAPSAAAAPAASKPLALRARPTPLVVPPDVEPLPASEAPVEEPLVELSEAELGRATTAGFGSGTGGGSGGSGGGTCDMVRFLQAELRKDPRIGAAVIDAHRAAGATSRAILVWDGDWIRHRGQEGKGLAGVREAMIMEIAFAPAACRANPMQGLVLISLSDAPGAVGLAFGTGRWRWSDLLMAR